MKEESPRALEWARAVVEALEERQGGDIVLLDLRSVATFADYFVICTAETQRHVEALCEEVDRAMAQRGASLHHQEGSAEGGWVLMDYGDVVVHVFSPEERDYYQLERVWSRATPLVRIL